MKNPRELLLSKHQQADPKLDVVRRNVVAEHVGGKTLAEDPGSTGFLVRLWDELFWSCRRAWCGLATVWIVVLVLNLAGETTSSPRAMAAKPGAPMESLRLVLSEQNRLRAELLGNHSESPADQSEPAQPSPRSENRWKQKTA